jgi:predicted DNA-binding transcriptional regulator AlpA
MSLTVDEWCERHRISRSMYYKLKSSGKGPRTMNIGAAVRITEEADREWVIVRERETAAAEVDAATS